jgi:DNA primase
MSYWIDLKYLKYLPLEQFTPKGEGKFNFKCPVCGDSKVQSHKKRGWALLYNNSLFIKCFNCSYSSNFSNFLKVYFPDYYSDYIKEKFLENDSFSPKSKSKENKIDIFAQEYETLNLQKIIDLPEQHRAIKYLKERKITKEMYKDFYYTDNFTSFVNKNIDSSMFKNQNSQDRRIVIPFFNKNKKIFAIQGRTIDNNQVKYLTVKMDKSEDKLYGLDKVNFSKTVYVCEGPIDSLFLDNSLACAGSLSDIDSIKKYTLKENIVIVPDNDFNNKQTSNFIEQALNNNYRVVIWPKNLGFKDINEGIKKGFSKEQIQSIIEQNTHEGLMGISKFKMRKI